jgi:hypothetical protein
MGFPVLGELAVEQLGVFRVDAVHLERLAGKALRKYTVSAARQHDYRKNEAQRGGRLSLHLRCAFFDLGPH